MPLDRYVSLSILADALAAMIRGDARSLSEQVISSLHPDALEVLANVEHFVADADIRSRDRHYQEMQENQMRQLISKLRRGAPREELLKISFLSD